jgi:flavin-binding protein dodecin
MAQKIIEIVGGPKESLPKAGENAVAEAAMTTAT